ncbi:MAG: energy-coupling factor transporter ATPase [Erysipelothrix sp.]|jgi:energy-coupling factor transport system ATP-binding protein|nr:energy-coupling factor transporter ATPase [Erysipelothrix sp.]
MSIIEIKNISFSYNNVDLALNDVSLSIPQGKYVTIVGHNGSGKSTIAKCIIGLLQTSAGEIIVDNLVLNNENVDAIRSKVGLVFQNPDNQFIGSTVKDDIAFGLENRRVDPKDMDEIIDRFAKAVNMHEYLNFEPTKLSGGQKQRVAIAGALSMTPQILILDEATSMLDPKGKSEVNDLVKQLHSQTNMTIISITHDIEEAYQSDIVYVMNEGKIIEFGDPKDVLAKETLLKSIKLDIPFALKFKYALNKVGIIVNDSNLEGMVKEL